MIAFSDMILIRTASTVLLVICFLSGIGQDRSINEFRNDHIDGLNNSMIRAVGFLDHSLPASLFYSQKDEECTGFMRIADKQTINLEGECTDTSLWLFEFDEHARVSGVIKGDYDDKVYHLKWYNYDNTLSYYLDLSADFSPSELLKVYQAKDEGQYDHLILWPDQQYMSLGQDDHVLLQWQDYNCPQAPYACKYNDVRGTEQNISISDQVVSAGSRLFQLSEQITIEDVNGHGFDHFYSYRYPKLGQSKYDQFIESIINNQIQLFEQTLAGVIDIEDFEPTDRLKARAKGDFFLSLVNDYIISGYLTFYSTKRPRVETVPFSFDRKKNRFYDLREVWQKDFNYAFFLKTIIENKKRELLNKEQALVRKLLRDEPFTHFNLCPEGMVFFTDYNFVYGRRHILIPFEEIKGFINDKSISNLINKRS